MARPYCHRPAKTLLLGRRNARDVDQHLALVDHAQEFEAEPIAADPGDAGRHDGVAAREHNLAADFQLRLAFDQGAPARQVAQPGFDFTGAPVRREGRVHAAGRP